MPRDMDPSEIKLYQCCVCGRTIFYPLPKRLKGKFAHYGCRKGSRRKQDDTDDVQSGPHKAPA